MSNRLMTLALMLIFSIALFGQTGKISGSVIDKSTGESLPGVNVFVEETSLGASTDIDGFYVILNTPVGKHVVKASYVGYKDVVISDVIVNIDNTTFLDINMEEAVGGTDVVEIVAVRALIRKEETNTRQIKTSEDISNLPVTSVQDIVQQTAGLVKSEGSDNVNVRGGRASGTQFRVDGVNQSNLFDGSFTNKINTNAVEEVTIQTGGFSAEYGDVSSGLIQIATKTGGRDHKIVAEVIHDGAFGDRAFGTNSVGYERYNINVGGPITDDISYFVSADILNEDDPNPSYIVSGARKGQESETQNFIANLKFNATEKLQLRVSGNYTSSTSNFMTNGRQFFDFTENFQRVDREIYSGALKGTFTFDSKTYLDASVELYHYFREEGDNKWWDNLAAYGSKALNDGAGSHPGIITANGVASQGYGQYDAGLVTSTNTVFNRYRLRNEDRLSARFNFSTQIDKHNIKIGGEFSKTTFRSFTINPRAMWLDDAFASRSDIETWVNNSAGYGYNTYGEETESGDYWNGAIESRYSALVAAYDFTGMTATQRAAQEKQLLVEAQNYAYKNPTNSGATKPKEPVKMAFWVNDVYSINDLVINAGIRLDYFDPNDQQFVNPDQPYGNQEEGPVELDPADLEDSDTHLLFAPRIGFTFPVSEATVFTANYGVFTQFPQGQVMYNSISGLRGVASAGTVGNPNLKPSETTQYELSVKSQLSDDILLAVTGYYKETENEIAIRNFEILEQDLNPVGSGYFSTYQNVDFGTSKGLDLSLSSRRINNLQLVVNYSLAFATGTGSTSGSSNGAVLFRNASYPLSEAALNFDQRHTFTMNADYRFGEDEGPMIFGSKALSNFGVNTTVKYNSGRPFTGREISDSFNGRGRETAATTSLLNGERQPSNLVLDLRIDKGFKIGTVNMTAFVDVLNVLNSENITGVHRNGGTASSDGFLESSVGENTYDELNQEAYRYRLLDPTNWGAPRLVRLGLRVNL